MDAEAAAGGGGRNMCYCYLLSCLIIFCSSPAPQAYLEAEAAGGIANGLPYLEVNSMAFVPLVGCALYYFISCYILHAGTAGPP